MEIIAEIRRRHFVEHETVTALSQIYKLSRPTIRKHLKTVEIPVYRRQHQLCPKLGEYHERLETWLHKESFMPRKQKRTAQRLFEYLQFEGYRGSYTPVQRYVSRWKKQQMNSPAVKQAFIPLAFPPGETCQFDWSQDDCMDAGGRAMQEQLPKRLSWVVWCKRSRLPISA